MMVTGEKRGWDHAGQLIRCREFGVQLGRVQDSKRQHAPRLVTFLCLQLAQGAKDGEKGKVRLAVCSPLHDSGSFMGGNAVCYRVDKELCSQ